jgi:hypothetical protein
MHIRGRVLGKPGQPLCDRDVLVGGFLLRPGSPVVIVQSCNGAFEMDLPEGEACLLANELFAGIAVASPVRSDASVDLLLDPRRPFVGSVVGHDSAPREGVRIWQEYAFSLDNRLVFTGFPSQGRVTTYREGRVLRVPFLLQPSMATTDADGSFRLLAYPGCDGKILLRLSEDVRVGSLTVSSIRTVWVDAARPEPILFEEMGSDGLPQRATFLLLPDGQSLDDIPPDPEFAIAAPAPPPDPRTIARDRIKKLREEACLGCGGHPPTASSQRVDLISEFVRALRDHDHEIRTQAICALAYMNAPECLDPLVAALENDDGGVRHYALMGLEWLGRSQELRPRVVDVLRRVVDNGDPWIHISEEAAAGLVELGERPDPSLFYESLRRDDGNHVVTAGALADLGRKDAVELILARLASSDTPHHLGKALEKLTGQVFGDSAVRWKRWLEENRSSLPPQATLEEPIRKPRALVGRAHARLQRQDVTGAKRDLDRTIALDPACGPAFALRAWLLAHHDPESALADATRAVELDADKAAPYSIRAYVRELRKDVAGAIDDLRRAISLVPPDSPLLAEMKKRLHALGGPEA